ncbi:MAG: HAD family hydrolase [Clostridia bacterium]|nr:HAD family hydrolase [Clostridia bacterium]
MAERKAYALFDFDGTLAKGDSILPFLWYCFRRREASFKDLRQAAGAYLNYVLKILDDTQAKEQAVAFLKGKSQSQVEALAEGFYQEVLNKRIFPQGIWEMQKCREEGMEVLIISASPDAYLNILEKRLGVQGIIATRCGVDDEGIYTGTLASLNCRGFNKTLRIAEYLAARGHELDAENSRSYGNSSGDLPMMELTRHPVVVNGSKGLKKALPEAEKKNWK